VRVELHPEARAEFRSAAVWYDEQRFGLGDEFVAEVTGTLARIAEASHSYALWPNVKHAAVPIRRALVQRFPYAIAFEVHADQIRVLAVAHAKRRPLYWLARTQPGPAEPL
jgi:plasmid stabilization system protein ParE